MILASNSQRRQEILKNAGFNFKVVVSSIEEISNKEDIIERILEIAEKKLEQIAKNNLNEFVLAADTVVELNGKIFGKPKNREEAFNFLKILSGNAHRVITAYVFKNISKGILIKDVVVSEVKFFELDDEIINWYLNTNEYFDKAGAYGIQGYGRILVEKNKWRLLFYNGISNFKFFKKFKKNWL